MSDKLDVNIIIWSKITDGIGVVIKLMEIQTYHA